MPSIIKKVQYLKLAFLLVLFTLLFSLLVSPASKAQVGVVGEDWEFPVQIGETDQGIILLKNYGEESEKVKLYQTDYLFFSDGTNVFGEPGELERSNANWLIFSPTLVEVPPGQTISISYFLVVPPDNSLVGTYWSLLMVEPLVKTEELSKGEESGVSIRQIVRYAIQFVTNIGDTGTRELKPLPGKLLPTEEGRVFQVDLENTGQRGLRPEVWLDLYNEKGLFMGRFGSERKCIYPGCSVRHTIDLSDVPKGRYKARVFVDSGGRDIFAIDYTLNF